MSDLITRRSFVKWSGASGLLIGVGCKSPDSKAPASTAVDPKDQPPDTVSSASGYGSGEPPVASTGGGQLSAWIHIADNDVITYSVPEAEMGQGIHTAVALIISKELGGDWSKAVATTAAVDPGTFGRQSTGGSTSIRFGFDVIRQAGAVGRELLAAAAAQRWKTDRKELRCENSKVIWDAQKKELRFSELVEEAAAIELKETPSPKKDFVLTGSVPRLDTFDKVTGRATYGIDVVLPGMLIGKSLHGPILGATVKKLDDTAARSVEGVRDVVQTSSSVVVIADHTWAAMKGRDKLSVQWNEPNGKLNDELIAAKMKSAVEAGTSVYKSDGKAEEVPGQKVVSAEYTAPYLAHAPMEPLSCTVKLSADRCDVWTSTQGPSGAANAAAEITGLEPKQIFVHSQYLGGGFGRRSQDDYVREAVETAKKSNKMVKLIWDREQDIRGHQYRPTALHRLQAAVDPSKGTLLSWTHKIASPSILKRFAPLGSGIDRTAIDGMVKYAAPHMDLRYSDVDLPVPLWFWRSVGHSQNSFAIDSFMNEAAKAAGRDPLEFRLAGKISRLNDQDEIEDSPRLRKVIEIAAEKAGWGKKRSSGRALGIGACESFGSFCAQVAEVSIEGGRPRVHKVVCVIDCGQTVNPDTIEAQMEGSIVYGLSAAIYGNISFQEGRVVEGNFDRYPVLRMREMPAVETHIVESKEKHGGVGEPGTPPIAGALLGAMYALDAELPRNLPVVRAG